MLITNLISRYMRLCKAAFSAEDGAKLNKSIQTNVMEMLFLLMVIPRKCNFTQMGRYGKRVEQCYRQTAERSVNWLEMNMWLSAFAFKEGKGRYAIVIDPRPLQNLHPLNFHPYTLRRMNIFDQKMPLEVTF